ncbi:hypothetical protein WA158_008017 [Blastocystis sp. Blastoise]
MSNIMNYFLYIFLILAVEASVISFGYDKEKQTIYPLKGVFSSNDLVAKVEYLETMNVTGWDTLKIETNEEYPLDVQATAVGFAEGYTSLDHIEQHMKNIKNINFGNKAVPTALYQFLQDQMDWMEKMIQNHNSTEDLYWENVRLVLVQLKGMQTGYNSLMDEEHQVSLIDLYMHNSDGDMETLLDIFLKDKAEFRTGYDCSAFIKRSKDGQLYAGHTTWRNYAAMLRIYKYYTLNYGSDIINAKTVGFSSSPGFISSKDDYYTTSNNIIAMETTNSVYDEEVLKRVIPTTVPCWIRSVVASRMAGSPREWIEIFGKYNSGTYNNQWMALDVTAAEDKEENVLVISEQIPGEYEVRDVSSILKNQTYWSSYNIPYIRSIYEHSGYPSKGTGAENDYYNCSRHRIFDREQVINVQDIESMKHIMQFNEYETDPLSEGHPERSISSRYDLRYPNHAAFGGIDSKITSTSLMMNHTTIAISGPTHQNIKPFSWSEFEKIHPENPSHEGLPDVYNFDWVNVDPKQN